MKVKRSMVHFSTSIKSTKKKDSNSEKTEKKLNFCNFYIAYLTSIVTPIIIYNKHILKIKLTENRICGKQWIVMQKQCAHREKSIY